MKRPPPKATPFDPAEHLRDEKMIAVFLADALEAGSDELFQSALQTAARARGMANIAAASGLGRESLYKALAPGAQPRFATVRKVMDALGVKMTIALAKSPTRKTAARAPVVAARPRGVAKAAVRKPRRGTSLP